MGCTEERVFLIGEIYPLEFLFFVKYKSIKRISGAYQEHKKEQEHKSTLIKTLHRIPKYEDLLDFRSPPRPLPLLATSSLTMSMTSSGILMYLMVLPLHSGILQNLSPYLLVQMTSLRLTFMKESQQTR